jgi:hypothetical protein
VCFLLATAVVGWSCAAEQAQTLSSSPPPVRRGAAEVPAKVRRYAERLIQRYDLNHDGVLEQNEWSKMQGQPDLADADRNGKITLDEWCAYIMDFGRGRRLSLSPSDAGGESAARPAAAAKESEAPPPSGSAFVQPPSGTPSRTTTFYVPKSRLPAGLPDWFSRRDLNGDGQVSLAEYAPNATPADVEQFSRYDRNGDGLITVRELLGGHASSGRKGGGSGGKGDKKSETK